LAEYRCSPKVNACVPNLRDAGAGVEEMGKVVGWDGIGRGSMMESMDGRSGFFEGVVTSMFLVGMVWSVGVYIVG
jgi:hypothetical protein